MMAPDKSIPLYQGNIYDSKSPFWKDPMNVMGFFKTFPCNGKPSRASTTGYCDCTGYHGKKDRRRSFRCHKYFCAPCMYVKVGDEWKEPTLCPHNDACYNCHTRFEQQFHPEVFKKMKCHDVVTKGECPRGPLCAFAHHRGEHPEERSWNMKPSEYLPETYTATPTNRAPIYPQRMVTLPEVILAEIEKEKETKTEVVTMKYAPGNPSFASIAAGGGGSPATISKPFSNQQPTLSITNFPEMCSTPSPSGDKPAWNLAAAHHSPTKSPSYEWVKVVTSDPSSKERYTSIGSIKDYSSSRVLSSSRLAQQDPCGSSTRGNTSLNYAAPEYKHSVDNERFAPAESPSSVFTENFPQLQTEKTEPKVNSENCANVDPFKVYQWENPIDVTVPSLPQHWQGAAGQAGLSQSLTPEQQAFWSARSAPPPEQPPQPLQQIVDQIVYSWNPNRNPPASTNQEYQLFPSISPRRKNPTAYENPNDFDFQMENIFRSVSPQDSSDNSFDDIFDSYIGHNSDLSDFWGRVSSPAITADILSTPAILDFSVLPYQSTTILRKLVSKFYPPCQKFLDAWKSHVDVNHPEYPCMVCLRRTPDGARRIVFHPCEHQVSCIRCYKTIKDCPLCGCTVIGRTIAAEWPHHLIEDSYEDSGNFNDKKECLKEGLSYITF